MSQHLSTDHSVFPPLMAALACQEIDQKCQLTVQLKAAWDAGSLAVSAPSKTLPPPLTCGIPARPLLVSPREVPYRQPQTPEGRARLLHAIAHIEFSAINLALDHAARFQGLPRAYYGDWITVAAEEAEHFRLLRERLQALGWDYGDFPAHAGLWDMAERTAHDVLARMALVPRTLEARGLDATPPIQKRLRDVGDQVSAAILDIILHDEIEHVGLGDRWFRYLCAERDLPVAETYRTLIREFRAPKLQRPLNESARLAAGFTAEELAKLLETE